MLKHFIICVDGAFWFQIPNQKFSTLQIVFTFSFSSKLWFHIESERRNPAHPELMECIDCIPFVLYQYLYYGFNFPKIHFQYSDCCAQHAIKYSNMCDVCVCVLMGQKIRQKQRHFYSDTQKWWCGKFVIFLPCSFHYSSALFSPNLLDMQSILSDSIFHILVILSNPISKLILNVWLTARKREKKWR